MDKKETADKRRGGSALLIIILIFGLALLLFVFITKQFNIRLVNRVSASIENGIDYTKENEKKEEAPQVNPRLVSLVYVLKEGKLSCCYIQVINAFEKNIFYMQVPLNSKLTLSNELYKDLLTYAPTLPQYVKLSRTLNYFSENYRYEACTRILTENLGIKVTDWCVMTEEDFAEFFRKSSGDSYSKEEFYGIYRKYANSYRNSLSSKERWAYYEIFDGSTFAEKESVPGLWDKTDFNINTVQTREIVEELKY